MFKVLFMIPNQGKCSLAEDVDQREGRLGGHEEMAALLTQVGATLGALVFLVAGVAVTEADRGLHLPPAPQPPAVAVGEAGADEVALVAITLQPAPEAEGQVDVARVVVRI